MAHVGFTWTMVILTVLLSTRVCEAASPTGNCSWRTCGTHSDASVRYPFRLVADPLVNRCYTKYQAFIFECAGETLYLNITGNITLSQDTYKVTKIDYWNQTLSLVPSGHAATCRPFDAGRFGGLNITNTTTLLLDCPTQLMPQCDQVPARDFSNPCYSNGSNVSVSAPDRYACPVRLDQFANPAYHLCNLFETVPPITPSAENPTFSVVLQFDSLRELSFTNFTSQPVSSPGPAPITGGNLENGKAKEKKLYIIVGVAIFGALGAIILFLLCLFFCDWLPHSPGRIRGNFRRKNIEAIGKLQRHHNPHLTSQKNHCPTTFYTLKELQRASKNFSDDRKLGSGGFGTVYKGTLDNGVEVAIKKSNERIVNMTGMSEQFINEVSLLSQVNHRNLVRLHGCCLEVEVPILVYEYVSNGDLFQHLHGERPGIHLSWDKRLQIAIDTAEALRYLHSAAYPPIYHRDMKTSNILLDDKFNVKIADFGISKLVKPDATHVSTAVKGTPGYLDPEYFRNFRLTDKSDVYSFGVVLLELLTSLKPVDFQRSDENANLAAMALPFIRIGDVKAIADPRLFDERTCDIVVHQMQRVGEVACKCLAERRQRRPGMKEVVEELVAIRSVDEDYRAGQESSEISDGEHEGVETVPVFKSLNFTSSSDSSHTTSSKYHMR